MLNKHENFFAVTVIITTFNRLNLLGRALKSLENQTFKDFEVIVSDDCSDMDVHGFLENYKKHSQLTIRYRRNSENKGACYTRNEGIKIARGKYIAGLDDDDEFTPNRLEVLFNAYKPEYSFITSNTTVVKKSGRTTLFKSERLINLKDMLWGNIAGTQVLTEKAKLLELGGFDEELTSAQDADMWLRLIERYGPALRLNEPLYILHTEHEQGRISTSKNKIKGLLQAYDKHSSKMNENQKSLHKFKLELYKRDKKLTFSVLKCFSFGFIPYLIYRKLFI